MPIGIVRDGKTPEPGKFLELALARDDGGTRYPHDFTSGANGPEAVDLLRRVLAAERDGTVVIVQIGFSTNLARLLASVPDEHSPLAGRDLVETKVRLLSIMAGAFAPIEGDPRYLEYNVDNDIASAQRLADDWPTPMVFSGFEIGIAVPYPAESIESRLRLGRAPSFRRGLPPLPSAAA